jgi:hypothetical protein
MSMSTPGHPLDRLDAFTTPQASQMDFPVPPSLTAKDERLIVGLHKEMLADCWRVGGQNPSALALISRRLKSIGDEITASNVFAVSAAMPSSQPTQIPPAAVRMQDLTEPAVRPKAGRPKKSRIKSGGEPKTPKKRGRPRKVQKQPVAESPVCCPPLTSTAATPDGKRRKREPRSKEGNRK